MRMDNAKTQLQQWFTQRPSKEALLSKSRSFGHKCPKHRNVSSHSLLGCNLFTQAAADLGWATVWKSAQDEDNRRRAQSIARNQANDTAATTETTTANQETNRPGRQRSNSTNTANNNTVAPYLTSTVIRTVSLQQPQPAVESTTTTDEITTTMKKDKTTTTQNVQKTNQQETAQQLPRPDRMEKRKWTHFPPKHLTRLQLAIDTELPMTTPTEENYLTDTTKCWDVVATKATPHDEYIIPDSGCRHHISFTETDFIDIHKFDKNDQPYVKMADDNTKLPIAGYGTIQLKFNTKIIRLAALYVPNMQTRLFSISQHIQYAGCAFLAHSNNAILTFPNFIIDVQNTDEFKVPVSSNTDVIVHFDEERAALVEDTPDEHNFKLVSPNEYIPSPEHWHNKYVHFKKLLSAAKIPTKGLTNAVGLDFSSIETTTLAPGETRCIKTGLACEFIENMYLRIAPRSGTALKGILVNGGVIDRDYRGDIGIILHNMSTTPFAINQGQKIAQGIFERHGNPTVYVVDTLSPTTRDKGGFGSTDKGTTNTTGKRRVQLCHFTETDVFQIDRTRGPGKIRARRMPPASILHNPLIVPPVPPPKPTEPQPSTTADPELIHTDSPQKPSSPPSPAPGNKEVIDWMTPLDDQQTPPNPPPEDGDDIKELYSDFTADTINENRRPPTVQRTSPVAIDPSETNIDTTNTQLNPENCEPIQTNIQDTPRVSIEDRPNSALPKRLNITKERLLQSIGYLDADKLIKLLPTLVKEETIHIQGDSSPRINPGQTTTMHNLKRSQKKTSLPTKFGDIWHVDIGFGPSKAIGGAQYCLFFVDNKTRYKHVFPLLNLTDSLLHGMRKFITKVGRQHIGEILTDFDEKIIGGDVRKLLDEEQIPISAAPPRRQSQNGLVESHWKNIVTMARNWLRAALLPSTFWWFAIKRAVEVTNNLLPSYHMDKKNPKNPFEYVYNRKPDPRNLIPLFSVADIKIDRRQGGHHRNKWESQSLRCITVGLSPKANCVMFYHPPSKQIIHAPKYRFDTFMPAGPQFNLTFDADFVFNTRADLENSTHRPSSHENNTSVYVTINGTTQQGTIIEQPINKNKEPYIVQLANNDIVEVMTENVSESDPNATPSDIPIITENPPHVPWIKDGAKVTLVPPGGSTPKQGYIIHSATIPGEWEFILGRKKNNPSIPLPNFAQNINSMITNKKLFKGWRNLRLASTARLLRALSNAYCRHVSAEKLSILKAPSLLKHDQLPEIDKLLWDEAYKEEYEGLQRLGTWKAVTEDEYQQLKTVIKTKFLPTMAISTIKYDGEGNPNRCKYRIVALGNLDPHNWSKQDCFAPVLSQLEHRTLLSLATRLKCIPKTGDVSQAFCQGVLPEDEEYYIKPPPGCPLTKKGGYLKLLKMLYGLKRSPRHWYEKARKVLLKIGFKQCPNAPCLFVGTLIPGHPPIYLGLYMDDFVYFSQSRESEQLFEQRFQEEVNVDFNGQIGYFLGINHRV